MPQSFEEALAIEQVSDLDFRLTFPDGWQQGRGGFGGLVLAALMNAMQKTEPDAARLPRALMGDLCGPALPVETRITTRVLRRGNRQTNVAATFEQGGAVVAHATAVLASPRDAKDIPRVTLAPPDRTAYADAAAIPLGPPVAPVFAQHYEYRPTGTMPFSQGVEPIVLGWIKERVPLTKVTAAAMIARLDAYYPASFSVEAAPRPIATVSYMAELLCDPAVLDPKEPLFYRARVVAQAAGYFVEMRELWNGDEPVALNQQTFALLG